MNFPLYMNFLFVHVNADSRPIDQEESAIISPVDATIETFGDITEDGIFLCERVNLIHYKICLVLRN